jgi:hypothetical protein
MRILKGFKIYFEENSSYLEEQSMLDEELSMFQ